ncbi:MAG: FKBP-type peptidyl-prolyl cis-trans isomerase [Candidatus Latescibacteria bacterium]|nr:FKBP-type peptidyl-prolyl cis-trans isomerase [Candidatus Latescibacterota bacterium]
MKTIMSTLIALILSLSLLSCSSGEKSASKKALKSDSERFGYALGMDIGTSLKEMQADIDLPSLMAGLRDTFEGTKALLTPEEAAEVGKEFSKKMQEKQAEKNKNLAEKNREEGEAFLTENKKKEGVVTTESGLQVMLLEEGDGPKPKATDQVKVHYQGTLLDGTEFDSSYKRGQPVTFPVNGVIAGWTEALQLMKVGSKVRLFIPSDLAYGERGAGQRIGPNATLIFEVELLGIEK